MRVNEIKTLPGLLLSRVMSCSALVCLGTSSLLLFSGDADAARIKINSGRDFEVIATDTKVEKCSLNLGKDYLWLRLYPGEAKGPFRFKEGYHISQISLQCRLWRTRDGNPQDYSIWVKNRYRTPDNAEPNIVYRGLSRL